MRCISSRNSAVGTAPLAFLIGASSYGELIFPGIYLNDFPTLILGAAATALFALILDTLLAEKAIPKGDLKLAVVGMRVDPRTRAAGELERFFSAYDLPVLAFLRNTQLYVQAAAQGATLFDFPPSRMEKDREQWQGIIDWIDA